MGHPSNCSTIFPADEEQATVAKAYIAQLDAAKVYGRKIATTIEMPPSPPKSRPIRRASPAGAEGIDTGASWCAAGGAITVAPLAPAIADTLGAMTAPTPMVPDFRARLRSGDFLLGTWLTLLDPAVTELLAGSGFDFLVADGEHGPVATADLVPMLIAARTREVPVLYRVAANEPVRIMHALDAGAAGVIVPQIRGVDDVQRAVAWSLPVTSGTDVPPCAATMRLSRTLILPNTCKVWKVRPTPRRLSSSGPSWVTSSPFNSMRPVSGVIWPSMLLADVGLSSTWTMMLASYTGVASRQFASQLGDRVNVYPVKGYSITVNLLDAQSQQAAPQVSLLDDETKLVTSRLGLDRFRVAGTAEFNGYNKDIRADRIQPLVQWVQQCFPKINTRSVIPWAGLRPMMPNMMPRVGRGKAANVFYNTGHGHLGWTLSACTAEMIADIIHGSAHQLRFYTKPSLGKVAVA